MDQQIEQIEPWSAKGSNKRHRVFDGAMFLGGSGPQDQLKVGPFDRWIIQKGIPTRRWAEGPANLSTSRTRDNFIIISQGGKKEEFYDWSWKGGSLRTTLSILEKEVRPKRRFGTPQIENTVFTPVFDSLKWHILLPPLFEDQHVSPWFELEITNKIKIQFSLLSTLQKMKCLWLYFKI